MASLNELVTLITSISTSLQGLRADIQALKAQIAAGGVVTQADLDNLFNQLQTVASDAAQLDSEQ